MDWTQYDWQHQYLATPREYPISANEAHSTYDQFIQLRDTLIFTGKFYNNKAGKRLIVGDKWDWTTSNTIEVWENNYFRQGIQPDWSTNPLAPWILWTNITAVPADIKAQDSRFGELSCMINKDGHYRIMHKEEILLSASTNKVFCYVDVYRKNAQDQYEIAYKWWVAVFDWEWHTSLSWSTSWTDPNWSCTVPITLGKLFKKMTALAEQERDLKKGDILVLRFQDWTYDSSTWEPLWNPLTIQQDSNYWSIEYLDLPYNI